MKITAEISNERSAYSVSLTTGERVQALEVPAKPTGGSQVNGGELLCLALATCYCNDVYREAAKRGITIDGVSVNVEADFGAEGAAATNIVYRAQVESAAAASEIDALLTYTDTVAEIQNTLRSGVAVTFERAAGRSDDRRRNENG
jgi:organic hydroperoxide reductase OsmC/OhrA